jgi:hypothetical protein
MAESTLLVDDSGTGNIWPLMPTLAPASLISVLVADLGTGDILPLMPTLVLVSPISIHCWSPTLVLATFSR